MMPLSLAIAVFGSLANPAKLRLGAARAAGAAIIGLGLALSAAA